VPSANTCQKPPRQGLHQYDASCPGKVEGLSGECQGMVNKKLGLSDAVACQPSAPFPRSALLLSSCRASQRNLAR
jgi:hypothetical protein